MFSILSNDRTSNEELNKSGSNNTDKNDSAVEEESGGSFKRKMEAIVASGAVSMSIALGVQLGLFKAMSELKVPASPTYIAKIADCNERFLREWLFHMELSGIVECESSRTRYSLPAYRARVLATDGAVDLATFIPSMGKLYDDLLKNVKTGNTAGALFRLPETDFCQRWERRQSEACEKLMNVLLKHVPSLQTGLDRGINVLDVGCGRGTFLFTLANQYPDSLFTGIDINDDLISSARDHARSNMLKDMSFTNVAFADYDAAILPTEWAGRFDVVIMHEVIYNFPSPSDVLWEVRQALKPGGYLIIADRSVLTVPQENKHSHAQYITALIAPVVSMNYSLPVALAQPEGDSEALGTCTGREKLLELIEEAYYVDVNVYEFAFDDQKVEMLIVARNED